MNTRETVYCAHSHETKLFSPIIFQYVLNKGYIPIDPFIIFPCHILEMNNIFKSDRLEMDLVILSRCDHLWVFGYDGTPGTTIEIDWWVTAKLEAPKYLNWQEIIDEVIATAKY